MKNKIALVTGANSGMGKALSMGLAKVDYKVILLCRDKERGSAALREVCGVSKNCEPELMLCDLGSLQDIRHFVNTFKSRFSTLDVLINNAGVILPRRYETKDGFELQFGVNHLGHFLLTNLLLDPLMAADKGRIVITSSGAHKTGKIHLKDIHLKKGFNFWKAYGQSKLANILFCYELARKLEKTSITVNCFHPGAVATNMGINRSTGFGTFITKIFKPFFKTPEQGADTGLFLATSPEAQDYRGKYFVNRKAVSSSKLSYNTDLAKQLWDLSEKLTGERW